MCEFVNVPEYTSSSRLKDRGAIVHSSLPVLGSPVKSLRKYDLQHLPSSANFCANFLAQVGAERKTSGET
jgi:hypothetical protein